MRSLSPTTLLPLLVALLVAAACDKGQPDPGAAEPEAVSASRSAAEPVPDDWVTAQPADYHLATRIRMRLMADSVTAEAGDGAEGVRDLRVRVTDRVVTLEGSTTSGFTRARAEAIATQTWGVRAVRNRIDGPTPSRAEQSRAAQVPAAVMTVEPELAEALSSYASGEPVARYAVARSARDRVPPDAVVPGVGSVELPELDNAAPTVVVELPAEAEPLPVAVNPNDDPDWTGEYTIQAGESLWSIAAEQLGDGNAWEELFEANRDIIGDDPNGIRVGMRIRLPR